MTTQSGSETAGRFRQPRRQRRAATAGCACLSAFVLVVALAGCGNWISVTDAGQLGVTVDESGNPVIAVMTCSPGTPVISLAEGRKKSDPETKENVQRGSWRARRAISGVEMLSLTAPGDIWKTTSRSAPLEPGRLFVVDGGTVEVDHASLGGVSFRLAELTTLAPGVIRVNGKTMSRSQFGDYQCRD